MGRLCFSCGAVLGVLAVALLVAPGEALNCTSQKFTNKEVYPNCTDLPHLTANLHWSFNVSNSSLSVAFVAPPAKPGGWVAWAINPTKTGMAGAQALVAFKSNGTVTIQTFDIKSYNFSQSGLKLSYEVWDLSAEESGGTIKIFGKWKLPAKTEKVNQVWQVGPGLSPLGYPMVHAFEAENLAAKAVLQLVGQAAAISPASEPNASAPGPNGSAPGSNGSAPASGAPRGRGELGVGISMAVFMILGSLIA
ncbi:cytochrome b561 and DOMON domain-containing protein At3g25290 [Corylus avellana]|uniref:cytochrome b561 and DOMON domain-containing protein At3g25290 n=1 Tax=Corylus avellana TaxID=13451 RepID=UPI001E21F8C9|nr:cytochrome b561 and DOMON domain-containing protein At3g25290 [Corylus avellana]